MKTIEISKLIRCTVLTAMLSIYAAHATATEWAPLIPVTDIGFPVESVVAVGGDIVVVGGQKSVGNNGAYIFERAGNQWRKVRITSSDSNGADGSSFGANIATNGSIIVVGGYSFGQDDVPRGGGYVFEKNNGAWSETKLLDGNEENIFIDPAVEIVGNSAVVSEPLYSGGYVRVFDKNNIGAWVESATLASAQATSLFGHHIAAHGNTLVASSVSANGRVLLHVYRFDGGWSQQTTLTTSYTNTFAVDIAVGDEIIAVSDSNAASVTVFRNQLGNSWNESRLQASGSESSDLFGSAVAVDGDRVIVGAMGDHENAYIGGAIYIYTANGADGWTESKWMAGAEYTEFGRDIDVYENQIVVSGNNVVYVADENSAPSIDMRRLNSGQLSFDLRSVMNNVSQWQLQLGTSAGGNEYFSSGVLSAATQSQTVSNLPVDGKSYVHMTLLFKTSSDSAWNSVAHKFVTAKQVTAIDSYSGPTNLPFSDTKKADGLISSVAVNASMIAVGRPYDVDVFNNAGSVTVYQFTGGSVSGNNQFSRSTPLTGTDDGSYATSIALTDSTLAVGQTSMSGAVLLYPINNLNRQAERRISASDANAALFESLGRSVALNDDVLVAGSGVGAYVFDGAANYAETKLSGEANVVAFDDDRVVVGFQHDDNTSYLSSSSKPVFVYEKNSGNSWQRTQLSSDGNASGLFGSAVAINGDTIVVGDPGVTDTDIPAIYVYEYNSGSWSRNRLTASDVSVHDEFGFAVAVNGSRIVVGAPGDDDNGVSSGAVYVYEKNSSGVWLETKWAADRTSRYFGQDVAMQGDAVVAASYSSIYLLDVPLGATSNVPAASGSSSTNNGLAADVSDNNSADNLSAAENLGLPEFIACSLAGSDPDGDGWGWENNRTCEIQPLSSAQSQAEQTQTQTPALSLFIGCQFASSDPDGDGWGWENGQTCEVQSVLSVGAVVADANSAAGFPVCSSLNPDPDGDGWGWENSRSCVVGGNAAAETNSSGVATGANEPVFPDCVSANPDQDGDGWGWENGATCRAAGLFDAFSLCQITGSDYDGDGWGWGWENGSSCRTY